jgi:nitrous oxidase accessory protein NosD
VFNGGDADIFIQGRNNNVMDNLITEAPVGILVGAGSTGNVFAANTFHGVTMTIQDPPTGNLSKTIVADRP